MPLWINPEVGDGVKMLRCSSLGCTFGTARPRCTLAHTNKKVGNGEEMWSLCGFSLRRDFYKLEKVGRCHSEAKIFSLSFCSQVTKLSYSRLTPRWPRAEFGCRHILLALMWQPVSTQFAASLLTFILPRCCAGTAVEADDRLQKSLAFPTGLQKQISAARDKHLAAQPKKPQASRRQRGNAQRGET